MTSWWMSIDIDECLGLGNNVTGWFEGWAGTASR